MLLTFNSLYEIQGKVATVIADTDIDLSILSMRFSGRELHEAGRRGVLSILSMRFRSSLLAQLVFRHSKLSILSMRFKLFEIGLREKNSFFQFSL